MLAVLNAQSGNCTIKIDTIRYLPQYSILQKNGEKIRIGIREDSYFGNFLGIYMIYDSTKILQRMNDCQSILLDKISAVKKLRTNKNEINWVLKSDGKSNWSSEWLNDFDSTFDAYCTFYPKISTATRKSILKYIGEPTSSKQKFNECYICFYNHNNLRTLNGAGQLRLSEMTSYINGREIITTAHGIILKNNNKFKWLYLSDHQEKLRWPTMAVDKQQDNIINAKIKSKKKISYIDSVKAFRN